jgi:hypothetical protein
MSTDKKISQLSSGAPAQAGDEYVVARSGANYKLTLTNIAANMPATTITSGNLIVSSGDVGIGAAVPGAKLQVQSGTSPTQPTWAATDVVIAGNSAGNAAYYQSFSDSAGGLIFSTPTTRAKSFLLWNDVGGNSTWQNGSTGALVLSTNGSERMRIDSSGNVGIGGTADATDKVTVAGNLPVSSTISISFANRGVITSATTGAARGFQSFPSTAAASFALNDLIHFWAGQNTLGAGSSVTNQYGFFVHNSVTGATNNYGFHSNIASGSNRWNFYAAGTAGNYFAGNTGIGNVVDPVVRLIVRGSDTTSSNYPFVAANSVATLFYIRNDGLIFTGLAAESPYNKTTGAGANMIVDSAGLLFRSTSSLRYKSDVTDATHGLTDVLKLRSVTYKGKNDGNKIFGGLIAEEVHDAGLTEFVDYDKEGRPDAIHYGNMVALLVKAVQELTARVAELEAK